MIEQMEYRQLMYEESTGDHEIRVYPNPVLREVCEPIAEDEFGPEIERLGNQMIALALKHDGYALAASQIGLLKRIFVMTFPDNTGDSQGPEIICNPVLEKYPEGAFGVEGCISMPGVQGRVWRSLEVHMTYRTPYGETRELVLLDLEARIAQHENDHLDGVLFFDHLSREQRRGVQKVYDQRSPARKRVA